MRRFSTRFKINQENCISKIFNVTVAKSATTPVSNGDCFYNDSGDLTGDPQNVSLSS